jgi:hypothetical protein
MIAMLRYKAACHMWFAYSPDHKADIHKTILNSIAAQIQAEEHLDFHL